MAPSSVLPGFAPKVRGMTLTTKEVRSTLPCKVSSYAILGERRQVTPGVLDDDARYLFNHGQCTALAIALAQRLNTPLKLVVNSFYDQEDYVDFDGDFLDGITEIPAEVIDEDWWHAVVEVDPDQYLDVAGIISKRDLLLRYFAKEEDGLLITTSEDQLYDLPRRCEGAPRPDLPTAELFVDAVLSEFL